MLPYRRFADILANACARLGAVVDRYSFNVMDFHHLLLAGLPAHPHGNSSSNFLVEHRFILAGLIHPARSVVASGKFT
jgi:hypothetical protein